MGSPSEKDRTLRLLPDTTDSVIGNDSEVGNSTFSKTPENKIALLP